MDPGIRAYYNNRWPTDETPQGSAGREEKRNRDKKYGRATEAPPKTADILYREWKKQHDERENTSRTSQ
jgi:hypothetical protein